MTDYALTPSLRRLRSALVIRVRGPGAPHAHPELVDAGDEKSIECGSAFLSSTPTMNGVANQLVPSSEPETESTAFVGRGGGEVDLDVAVRALPRIERRRLMEEVLGRDGGQPRQEVALRAARL